MPCEALIGLLSIVFPLRYFYPVDPEAVGEPPQFDYGVDDPSLLSEQLGKPPLITRYRLLFSLLLALE